MNDTTEETAPLGGHEPGHGAGAGATDAPTGPHQHRPGLEDLDRLRRSTTDRKLAGVAGGLGRHFGVDPTILRVLFVVLSFFGGAGLLLYAVGWLFLPADDEAGAPFGLSAEVRRAILVGSVVVAALLAIGDSLRGFDFGWPLAIIALAVGVWLVARDRSGSPTRPPQEGNRMSTTYTPVDDPADTPPPWQPPSGQPPAGPPPRRPRRTGVIWFWPTLALIAIGCGVLGVYDADHAVAHGAYPALALAITGVMLVVGAVRGRPGGLILVGIVAVLNLAAMGVVGNSYGTDARQVHRAPLTAAAVQGHYDHSVGQIVLDLTGVQDPEQLAGREIDVDLRTGQIKVIVPRSLNVEVEASIDFAGGIDLPGDHSGGWATSTEQYLPGVPATDNQPLQLDLDAKFGQILVEQR